jgi:Gpi18-like mannosyltransferase
MRRFRFIKSWFKREVKKIFLFFLVWRIWLTVFAFLAVVFVPLKSLHFLGGGAENYLKNPVFWGWANFDGVHYLDIAQRGYRQLEHSFFPLYPLLVGFFAHGSLSNYLLVGVFISNLFFVASLFLLWRLFLLDFKNGSFLMPLLALLLFPTSFYFASVYTESLFLFLALCSFYFARKGRFLEAAVFAALSSATRIYGVLLLPALFGEWKRQEGNWRTLLSLLLAPLGLLFYMFICGSFTERSVARSPFTANFRSLGSKGQAERLSFFIKSFSDMQRCF